MPFGLGGYAPHNPSSQHFDPPIHRAATHAAPYNPEMDRPGFYESTINWMFENAESQIWQMPNGPRRLYRCAVTREWLPYEAMQIDHIQPWQDFLATVQPGSHADALDAYNDVNNLRLISASANTSKDYNFRKYDEDEDEYDDDDDFIDDSEAESKFLPESMRKQIWDQFAPGHYQTQYGSGGASEAHDAMDAMDATPSRSALKAGNASRALTADTAADAGSVGGELGTLVSDVEMIASKAAPVLEEAAEFAPILLA